jgi:FkbM family methyltransferase
MAIQKEEILFYEKIKGNCKVVFDIGCREDIDYVSLSENKIFHYFEPNPNFCLACQKNLEISTNNIVYLNNFGIGNQTKEIDYYPDGQSFFRRKYIYVSTADPITLSIKRFNDYISDNKIEYIDFLKMDTEGGEPDILLDNPNFIKTSVKYVQFEWASTWVDRGDGISLSNIIEEFEEYFDFYFLYDANHPISKAYKTFLTKIDSEQIIKEMTNHMMNAYGFNIIMIRKEDEIRKFI